MKKLEDIKLFRDLEEASLKYRDLEFKNKDTEIEYNTQLQNLLISYKSQLSQIKNRYDFISKQVKDQSNYYSSKNVYNTIISLNNLVSSKCDYIKNYDLDREHTCVHAVIGSTVDELSLINNSIKNKDFLKDKHTYLYIYEKISINSFMNFLALKDMSINKNLIDALSQLVLAQIQSVALVSL